MRPILALLALAATGCSTLIGADFDVQPEPDAGKGGPVTLAGSLSYPYGLALGDDGFVYVAVTGVTVEDGRILKIPIAGGGSLPLATGIDSPSQVAVRGGYVYWTTAPKAGFGDVSRIRTDGSEKTPEVVATHEKAPIGVAVDDVNVYWAASDIRMMPIGDIPSQPPPKTLNLSPLDTPSLIALDGNSLFVTEFGTGGGLSRVAIDTGQTTRMAMDSHHATGIAQTTALLFYTSDDMPGALTFVRKDGSGTGVIRNNLDQPAGAASDGTYVYWVNFGSGEVQRVAEGGGTVTTIASGESSPDLIAVDESYVYWTNNAPDGAVRRAPKP